jgi:hypothetical protein
MQRKKTISCQLTQLTQPTADFSFFPCRFFEDATSASKMFKRLLVLSLVTLGTAEFRFGGVSF